MLRLADLGDPQGLELHAALAADPQAGDANQRGAARLLAKRGDACGLELLARQTGTASDDSARLKAIIALAKLGTQEDLHRFRVLAALTLIENVTRAALPSPAAVSASGAVPGGRGGLDGAPSTAFRVGGQLICGLGAFIGPAVGISRGGRRTTDGSLQTSCPAGSEPKGIAMPWFPDFISAAELARRQTRAAGQADPVAQYITALNKGDIHAMESVWPGEVVVYEPRVGEIRGHKQLRRFVSQNQSWLAGRHARIETVASTSVGGRAVVELLGHLAGDGPELAWPVAVVAESPDDRSVVFRTYCSQQPVDGRRHVRSLIPRPLVGRLGDVVGRYQTALNAGDADAIVGTFVPDGYYREPIGPHLAHRGTVELRSFFTRCFSQLSSLGQPQPAAPGRHRSLRTRPTAGRGPHVRRHRSTHLSGDA